MVKQKSFKILIDPQEKDPERVKLIIETFGKDNCQIMHLWYGDYQVMDKATNKVVAAFEWKSAQDFDQSVASERIFNQAIDIATHFPHHYVFIESNIRDYVIKNDRIAHEEKALKYKSLKGAIASLNQITTVVENHDLEEAVMMLKYHARKANDTHPRQLRHVKKDYDFLHTSLIAQPNFKYERTKQLISELSLRSIHDLTNLTIRDIISIDGIGPKLTDTLMRNIHGEDYKNMNISYDVDIRDEFLKTNFLEQFRENHTVKFIQQPDNKHTIMRR